MLFGRLFGEAIRGGLSGGYSGWNLKGPIGMACQHMLANTLELEFCDKQDAIEDTLYGLATQ